MYVVGDIDGNIYQLEHFSKNRTKIFRKINKIVVGYSVGYRINRCFYTSNKMKKLHVKTNEFITIGKEVILPF